MGLGICIPSLGGLLELAPFWRRIVLFLRKNRKCERGIERFLKILQSVEKQNSTCRKYLPFEDVVIQRGHVEAGLSHCQISKFT